jgi:endogenous inhibitor of DNA gyrase (YacG/DUF329 family)
VTLAMAIPDGRQVICPQCGESFVPRRQRSDQRFCKAKCRTRWHADRRAADLAELNQTMNRALTLVQKLTTRKVT